jgi:hypothetical protein
MALLFVESFCYMTSFCGVVLINTRLYALWCHLFDYCKAVFSCMVLVIWLITSISFHMLVFLKVHFRYWFSILFPNTLETWHQYSYPPASEWPAGIWSSDLDSGYNSTPVVSSPQPSVLHVRKTSLSELIQITVMFIKLRCNYLLLHFPSEIAQ